ncbi:MAG TPA: 50S ribosomal protein L30 [Firmicutes bacterium]|uniref:50S ribosomal protein L30 n=1 Tax=Candidatus Coatesbacteria bacterium 4484_99 TaxID=1970774 RepID=A0A1W9S154_9BACT|nr:MAG: 50S ribosomal protein L30 [Candidatus Coatesbacteria bacterium 4484_99]RLC39263.1 MAG: 50S ribosomal protein L30 [Candidatus Coatesbacteria bacterium]HDM42809.1 50S ribosomal protein L30 [Bacillota bacterium]RLC41402.1 MAG: 50S ribosomal protein L30 [Candidatus Coatesbacteria bacterium]RLC44722.1 MAG: 50S ribosomal protein L30 [Candidatus Coatesbacteria bacterium]
MTAKEKKIKVTLVRSLIGKKPKQRATARALGLTRRGKAVVHKATPSIVGMVRNISSMVKVEEVD